MKYIYSVKLMHGNNGKPETIIRENCSDYIKAMEAVKDAMEFAEDYGYAAKSCFNEIYNVARWFRKYEGYVRAWKAITDDIYVIHLDKVKLNDRYIRSWLR